MKNTISNIAVILSMLSLISCSQDVGVEEDYLPKTRSVEMDEYDAKVFLMNHLQLDESEKIYFLDIDQTEAEKAGIPTKVYKQAIEDITSTNRIIKETIENNKSVVLTSPAALRGESANVRNNIVPYASFPSGRLSVDGNGEVARTSFWAPYEQAGVSFLCLAKSATVCIFKCQTIALGHTIEESGVGSWMSNTEINVGLAASNTSATVCFSANDANGATASYSGY